MRTPKQELRLAERAFKNAQHTLQAADQNMRSAWTRLYNARQAMFKP